MRVWSNSNTNGSNRLVGVQISYPPIYSRLAQQAEHPTVNRAVIGSNPMSGAIFPSRQAVRHLVLVQAFRLFESILGRIRVGGRVEMAADCKSALARVRWFESTPAHYI